MPREDAVDLLRWLRHNRPLGMPDRTFDGLLDALANAAAQDTADPVDRPREAPDFYCDTDGTLYWNLRKHPPTPEGTPGVFDATPSATPLWLATRQRPTAPPEDRVTAAMEGYRPEHCPTCRCEPAGPLPAGVSVDPYCPEHGCRPTAYSDCSCFRQSAREDNGGAGL
jgi:hypothetical protein